MADGKTVLVTGGAGFIGSHLCEALLKQGHEVICADNLLTGRKENIAPLQTAFGSRFIFQNVDVNTAAVDELFQQHRFDWVFHHAAVVGVKTTQERPLAVLNDIMGIQRVLELSRKHDVKKVLFASSSEVYGEPTELPEREEGPINPSFPYAVTKLMGEKYFQAYFEMYRLPTVSLRLFNVYGPRQRSDAYGFVVGIFIQQCWQNQSPTIFGDGSQTRDFVYIKDTTAATIAAMETKKTNGEVLNIGTGEAVTILELAKKIISLTGKKVQPKLLPKREKDIMHRQPDIGKMRKLLEFDCQYTLKEGLKETILYYEK